MSTLISILGIFVLLFVGFLMCRAKNALSMRTIGGALSLQIVMAAFVLYFPLGRDGLAGASRAVQKLIEYSNEGMTFLFGGLVSPKMFEIFGSGGFIFVFRVLPPIIFFAAFIGLLYHLGIMQWVIKIIGGVLQKILGTSKAESMSAAANIFVGCTEAPLLIRPYIKTLTNSELFAVMAGGLASVAGAVMVAYAGLGVHLPYLIAASFMSAPGGLLFAKILIPQTDPIKDVLEVDDEERSQNILDAVTSGAMSGLHIAANVAAMLLAFIALIATLNGIFGWVGSFFGHGDITLQTILGYIFRPLAWIIGVPWGEAQIAGSLIGTKIILNEFVAYAEFVKYLPADAAITLSEKTKAIISFALCGFANLGSIGILIGGLAVMAPKRRADVARLGFMALIAGTLSNLMSAAIAGLFIGISTSL